MSVRKAAALAIAQLGIAAFFVSGVTVPTLGASAPSFVFAATVLAMLARLIDIESWGLLIPGGFVGRVTQAFGAPTARLAAATAFVERLFLAALACIVVGHYMAAVAATAIAGWRFTGYVKPEDLATLLAVIVLGVLWISRRVGRDIGRESVQRAIWVGVAILVLCMTWGVSTVAHGGLASLRILTSPPPAIFAGPTLLDSVLTYIFGLALTLPVVGGGEVLRRAASEFPPPRIAALRRTALVTVLFALSITTLGAVLFVVMIPAAEQSLWLNAPLAGVAQHLAGPSWSRSLVAGAVAAAALLVLVPAAHAALGDAERMLQRFSAEGGLPRTLAALHTRFGTPTRVIDVTVAAIVVVMLASSGRIVWLSHAYALVIVAILALTAASLLRLRRTHPGIPFKTPANVHLLGRELPLGLMGAGLIAAVTGLTMLVTGDIATIAAAAGVVVVAIWFTSATDKTEPATSAQDEEGFDLLQADSSLEDINVRPGSVLVPVRNPHALGHVRAALQTPGDRDVVVMTVRMHERDVSEETASQTTPTPYERRLFADVVTLAEHVDRPVRLLIVPATNVVDAIVGTIVRLRSSDVYVGESATLSAADQARLLGDAWERADKPDALDVRLVIYHRSGRGETYHLGAHPPSLTSGDLDLIHRLWLDSVKTIGPHVHHHDVVRAALKQMEQQLSGPNRDDAIAAIRDVARPAEELAAVLRSRDYGRLRDMLRNRHAGDVATLLTELPVEDQVVVFRVLPRKDAAAVFEYLSLETKEALLKAMAQEDVAVLLNNMAPDDRTLFLEELPAEATRHLLSLLTPAERSVAVTLLGYPERSVGRLMTPHYVAVREQWTVREVLDYVRAHGQDSETLNVIYVVDAQGLLIDDIRIREFLLAPLDRHVADLMDRRFVALKATDDQEAAVAVFRQYDRSALPVTDTTGMLIGIVTIDDVLDVAEATATRDIQRIGGSEALDEPYISISFWLMVRKRAGWLMALFLGEMLTATAMGAYEGEIKRATVLAMFVPLIISSGGNSGSQAATLVIRALALGEVRLRDWWRVMRREIFAGLSLGAILGTIGFLRITLWSAFSDMYGPHWLLVAVTVAIALVGVVLWGTLSGSLLPFVLKRLGFDPAASSAPFVATLVDVTGLVIYFSVALLILGNTLLSPETP